MRDVVAEFHAIQHTMHNRNFHVGAIVDDRTQSILVSTDIDLFSADGYREFFGLEQQKTSNLLGRPVFDSRALDDRVDIIIERPVIRTKDDPLAGYGKEHARSDQPQGEGKVSFNPCES